ncbi:hypothetical protein [Larsenimonas suaedae]|uniref:Uncharacterized protein n=1 Tax=Larsenimonas suaedae TaxID=1851019 RepID=A0ABU1GZ93_9GAMM|nr:hypothetical protein [Larsenimonas suaedae]MCM2973724.1 hypothetical protein [Larsenimonas suaedae]MDR5897333.1 hypothetical protein [Larsenimonas suaedae]
MAQPITWRNVTAPSTQGASSLFQGAQQSLDNSLGALGRLVDREQKTNRANWENQRNNNTQDVLNQLGQFQSVDEYNAARESGALAQLQNRFGRQVDQSAVRQAMTALPGQLMKRGQAEAEYEDFTRQRDERPLVNQYQSMIANQDYAGAQALLDQHDLLNEGELAGMARNSRLKDAAERRANRADGRAAASLRMRQTAFNQGQQDRASHKAGEAILQASLNRYAQQDEQATQQLNSLAKRHGIPVVNGQPDLSKVGDDKTSAFRDAVNSAGISVPSWSQRRQELTKTLMANKSISPSEVGSLINNFDGYDTLRNELSSSAKNKLGVQSRDAQEYFSNKEKELAQRTEDARKRDIFHSTGKDPASELADIMPSGKALDDRGFSSSEQADLQSKANAYMTKGFPIGDGASIPVPASVMKLALSRVTDNFYGFNTSLDDVIESWANEPATLEAYEEHLTLRDKSAADRNNLKREKTEQLSSLEANFKKRQGVKSVSTRDFLETLGRFKPR